MAVTKGPTRWRLYLDVANAGHGLTVSFVTVLVGLALVRRFSTGLQPVQHGGWRHGAGFRRCSFCSSLDHNVGYACLAGARGCYNHRSTSPCRN